MTSVTPSIASPIAAPIFSNAASYKTAPTTYCGDMAAPAKRYARPLATHGKNPIAIVELHPGRLGQLIFGAPVIPPAELVNYRGAPVVVSVAGATARQLIRANLQTMEFVEQRDYILCA